MPNKKSNVVPLSSAIKGKKLAKPTARQVNFDNIPQALKALKIWVLWKFELNEQGTKWTKVPYQPTNPGKKAASDNPETWSKYATAKRQYEKELSDGIGVVLTETEFVGGDLDYVLGEGDEYEEIEEWAGEIIGQLADCAYIERSVTVGGGGLRFFSLGKAKRSGKGGPQNRLEIYDHTSPRFLTITGDGCGEIKNAQEALDLIHEKHMRKAVAAAVSDSPISKSPPMSDKEVLEHCEAAKNGAKLNALWEGKGDPSREDQSESSDDWNLARGFAFYTQDAAQIERLMRLSQLGREKWDELRAGQTYIQYTIIRAIDSCSAYYSASNDWPELKPLPTVSKAKAFPVEALGALKEVVEVVAEESQIASVVGASSVLASAAAAFQERYDVKIPGLRRPVPVGLYFLTSAIAAGRKTMVDALVNEEFVNFHKKQLRDFRESRADTKPGKLPERFPEVLMGGRTTIQNVMAQFAVQPGLLITTTEGGDFFGNHSMNKDNKGDALSFYNESYDGQKFSHGTAGLGNKVYYNRRSTLSIHTQPIVTLAVMNDPEANERGTTSRFLIAEPDLPDTPWTHKEVPDERHQALLDFDVLIGRCLLLNSRKAGQLENFEVDNTERIMRCGGEAKKLWVPFVQSVMDRIWPGKEWNHIFTFGSRVGQHTMRIAAVLEIASQKIAEEKNKEKNEEEKLIISETSMKGSIKILEFYVEEMLRLKGEKGRAHIEALNKLLKWIKTKETFSVREIKQFGPYEFQKLLTSNNVEKLLEELAACGIVRKIEATNKWEFRPEVTNEGGDDET